jgi:hypothetical protein
VASVYPVPPEIQALMTHLADTAPFTFTGPVGALLRLLLLSPMGADARNLAFPPKDGDLRDYCNGARMQRVHDALPKGAAALTCAIYFVLTRSIETKKALTPVTAQSSWADSSERKSASLRTQRCYSERFQKFISRPATAHPAE